MLVSFCSWAQDDEVDYVELAAVLVQDGHYDRAEQALRQVPDPTAEGVDTPRYHTIYGLIHLNRNVLQPAIDNFEAAIRAGIIDETTGREPEVIHIYLAQAHFGLERYGEVLAELDLAGESARRLSSAWNMRAHAHWMLDQQQAAFDVLDTASSLFPENYGFLRRQVFYLIELGLHQRAADLGRRYLELADAGAEDYVAIGNALRQAREYDLALQFLEAAHLEYPDNVSIAKVLAYTWLEAGKPLAAAEIFRQAAILDPSLISEAAELYRRAGQLYEALMLNGRIVEQDKKLRQRLAILLALQRYEQITTMEEALYRAGLLGEEDLRYALAYAWFQVGDYERAESHLTTLTSPELFRKAVELRRAMEECAAEPWRCG